MSGFSYVLSHECDEHVRSHLSRAAPHISSRSCGATVCTRPCHMLLALVRMLRTSTSQPERFCTAATAAHAGCTCVRVHAHLPPFACSLRVQRALIAPCAAQVCVRLGRLKGCLPQFEGTASALGDEPSVPPVEVLLEVYIALDGHVLDGPLPSTYAPASSAGAAWGDGDDFETVPLAVKVRVTSASSQVVRLQTTCGFSNRAGLSFTALVAESAATQAAGQGCTLKGTRTIAQQDVLFCYATMQALASHAGAGAAAGVRAGRRGVGAG